MKTAIVLYDGFSILDFASLYEPLRLLEGDCHICAPVTDIYDATGLHFYPTKITQSLAGYDRVIVPGGAGALERLKNASTLSWLATAAGTETFGVVNEGVLLAAAAGLAPGRRAAVRPELRPNLIRFGLLPSSQDLEIDGPLASAQGALAGWRLSQWLSQKPQSMHASPPEVLAIPVTGSNEQPNARRASINRQTGETQVEVRLDIDGAGRHQINTGLPFFDHMLAQLAVHGLFDLFIEAKGDLHIDPHHTVEDVALTLGAAFAEALGARKGIMRMASADCPMDESLAWACVDFSGRPYCIIQADFQAPMVGSLPTSLLAHFFESFAVNARCNLHAIVRYGRDDHHKVEALFKAFARALCAATRIDPRRADQVPSSKGILF